MTKISPGVAKLHRVVHDRGTDDVFVTFKVISNEYKELIFRLQRHDDIEVVFRGDELDLIDYKEDL